MLKVPFFSQDVSFTRQWPRIEQLLDDAIDVGQFINGPVTSLLEAALARWTGARHVVAVASGTDALIIALESCGIGPGDEIIVPAYTFAATATAVAHAGARPLFVDIDPDTYAIDCDQVERAVEQRPDCKGVIPVHLFQHMADMHRLGQIATQHSLLVLEDSAEAIGMWQDDTHAGRFGRAGVLSFFPSKTLGGLGDAGAVITDDDQLAENIKMRRSHGARLSGRSYVWEVQGWNSRMDDIQASVLLARLEQLEGDIARRQQLASLYSERLSPLADRVRTPRRGTVSRLAPVYVYLIEARDRDGLVKHLARNGIGTEVYYPRALHQQPCFSAYASHRFPVAEHAARHAVALPLYPDLTDAQAEYVCQTIVSFYSRKHRHLI